MSNVIQHPDYVSNLQIGGGYNSLTQTPTDIIMKVDNNFAIMGDPDAGTIVSEVKQISSRRQLESLFGIHGSAKFGIGNFGTSSAMELVNSIEYSEYSYFCYVRIIVSSQQEVLKNFEIGEDALQYINQPEVFNGFAGDSFVSSRNLGGEFLSILKLNTKNSNSLNKLKTSFSATYSKAFSANVTLSNEIKETIDEYNGTFTVIKRGGKPAFPFWDEESVRNAAMAFPGEVLGQTKLRLPFRVSTMPYSSLIEFANKNYYDISGTTSVLKSLETTYAKAEFMHDSILYIIQNPSNFKDPNIDELIEVDMQVSKVMNLIRTTVKHCINDPHNTSLCKILSADELAMPTKDILPQHLTGKYKVKATKACGIQGYEQKKVMKSCAHPNNGEEIVEVRHFTNSVNKSNGSKEDVEKAYKLALNNPNIIVDTDPINHGFDTNWKFHKVEVISHSFDNYTYDVENPLFYDQQTPHSTVKPTMTVTGWKMEVSARVYFKKIRFIMAPNEACGYEYVDDLTKPIYKECEHPSHGFE